MEYISHRLKRLPDTPHKIAMGIACGVFVTFTPLYGMHFFAAWFLALVFRGNVLAALLGTFVGNPITFPVIAATSYQLGLRILGMRNEETVWTKIRDGFEHAAGAVWANAKSVFGYEKTTWDGVQEFAHNIFLPYLVGGIIPGLITAGIFYVVTKPLIAKYQKRRRLKLLERRDEQKHKRDNLR